MKYLFSVFLLFNLFMNAQDTLIFKNQSKAVSLILLVGEDSIRYKKMENITGPDLYAHNSDITFIKYKTGRVENIDSLYQLHKSKSTLINQLGNSMVDENSPEKNYQRGKFNAEVNYKCKGCMAGYFALGLVFGPGALVPAFSTMFVTPAEKKLKYPSDELWQDQDYRKGYKDKARSIKRAAIIRGVSIGIFSSLFAWGVFYTQINKT